LTAAGLGGLAYWILQAGSWEAWIEKLGLAAQEGYSLDSLGARLEIWSRAVYGLEDFPLTGMGMNTFREVVHVLYPFFTISPDLDIAHAHNEFLQAGLDLGLPGLIAYLSLYLISFWMLLKSWRAAENTSGRPAGSPLQSSLGKDGNLRKTLVLGLGGGLLAHLVFGMADAISLGAKPGIFFWYLLALINTIED
jgi:O-antigen ligase